MRGIWWFCLLFCFAKISTSEIFQLKSQNLSYKFDRDGLLQREQCIMSRVLTFVTGNAKKLEEVKAILGKSFPFEVVNEKIDLPGQ